MDTIFATVIDCIYIIKELIKLTFMVLISPFGLIACYQMVRRRLWMQESRGS